MIIEMIDADDIAYDSRIRHQLFTEAMYTGDLVPVYGAALNLSTHDPEGIERFARTIARSHGLINTQPGQWERLETMYRSWDVYWGNQLMLVLLMIP